MRVNRKWLSLNKFLERRVLAILAIVIILYLLAPPSTLSVESIIVVLGFENEDFLTDAIVVNDFVYVTGCTTSTSSKSWDALLLIFTTDLRLRGAYAYGRPDKDEKGYGLEFSNGKIYLACWGPGFFSPRYPVLVMIDLEKGTL